MSQNNFDASRLTYLTNGSRAALFADAITGSINQDKDDTREHAPSLLSIIFRPEEDIAGNDDNIIIYM